MSLGIYETEPAGNKSGEFLWTTATLRFQRKQKLFHQIGQTAGKLLSQLCYCQLGLQWLSPLFFPACTSHPTFFRGLGTSLLQTFQHIFPWWLFSHVLIHLPGLDLKTQRSNIREASQLLQKTLLFLLGYFSMSNQQTKQKFSILLPICLCCVQCIFLGFLNLKDLV